MNIQGQNIFKMNIQGQTVVEVDYAWSNIQNSGLLQIVTTPPPPPLTQFAQLSAHPGNIL
jgi:hypothetical protein